MHRLAFTFVVLISVAANGQTTAEEAQRKLKQAEANETPTALRTEIASLQRKLRIAENARDAAVKEVESLKAVIAAVTPYRDLIAAAFEAATKGDTAPDNRMLAWAGERLGLTSPKDDEQSVELQEKINVQIKAGLNGEIIKGMTYAQLMKMFGRNPKAKSVGENGNEIYEWDLTSIVVLGDGLSARKKRYVVVHLRAGKVTDFTDERPR